MKKLLLIIPLLLLISVAPARACTSPCVNQGTSVAGATTVSITPQATGDEIVINSGGCATNCATFCAGVTSSPSYTWHGAAQSNVGGLGAAICYAENVSTSATTITPPVSTTRVTPYDLVGVATSSTLDVAATSGNISPGLGVTGTTATSHQASEIAVGIVRDANGANLTAIGGTVGTWTDSTGTGSVSWEGYTVGGSIGTYGATTGSSTGVYDGAVAAFKVASAATPTPTATATATATATSTATATATSTATATATATNTATATSTATPTATATATATSTATATATATATGAATPTPFGSCTPNATIYLLNSSAHVMNGGPSAVVGPGANWAGWAVDPVSGDIVDSFTGTASGLLGKINHTFQIVDGHNRVCAGTVLSANTCCAVQFTVRVCNSSHQVAGCTESVDSALPNLSVQIQDANGFIDDSF